MKCFEDQSDKGTLNYICASCNTKCSVDTSNVTLHWSVVCQWLLNRSSVGCRWAVQMTLCNQSEQRFTFYFEPCYSPSILWRLRSRLSRIHSHRLLRGGWVSSLKAGC